jgi:hypothetical protein
MSGMSIAIWGVRVAGLYLAAGFVFAVAFLFVFRGVDRIDPSAREGTWGFRLAVLPGVTALWPIFASRWRRGRTEPPAESNAHRRAAAQSEGVD